MTVDMSLSFSKVVWSFLSVRGEDPNVGHSTSTVDPMITDEWGSGELDYLWKSLDSYWEGKGKRMNVGWTKVLSELW